MSEVDWHFLSTFLEAFQPLRGFSQKLQIEQYIADHFYRDLMCCEVELDELQQQGNFYAQLLLGDFKYQKEQLLNNTAFLAALYMDPHFNFISSPFLTDDKK